MKKKLFLICDSDKKFSDAFATYLAKKKDLSFTVHACHSPEQIKEAGEGQDIGVLMIGSHFPKGKKKLIHADWTFILTEDETETEVETEVGSEEGICIYKFQAAEAILAEMFTHMGASSQKQNLFVRGRRSKQFRMIGIFSPIHRTGQSEYAMNLGQEYALTDAVLYLSLELYGGFHEEASGSSLEDLVYHARQDCKNLGMLLTTMVRQKGKLDYILPVKVSENLRVISVQEWQELFSRIARESVYDIVILDMDSGIPCPYEILSLCTEVHVRTTEDEMGRKKMNQFEEELRILGHEDIRKKIKKVPA